jgi:hypothetical protein
MRIATLADTDIAIPPIGKTPRWDRYANTFQMQSMIVFAGVSRLL